MTVWQNLIENPGWASLGIVLLFIFLEKAYPSLMKKETEIQAINNRLSSIEKGQVKIEEGQTKMENQINLVLSKLIPGVKR